MKRIQITILMLFSAMLSAMAQYSTLNAHSHNDYSNDIPFWLAYCNHFGSVEADIFVVGNDLFVAHNESDISPDRSLDILYIQPIVKLFKHNGGKAWNDISSSFQLLIDLKTPTEPTLSLLVEKLKKYPEVFDPKINKNAVHIVITGNRPLPEKFSDYPDFIFFDGVIGQKYNEQQLKRVALFSENLTRFTKWNGRVDITGKDKIRLQNVIDSVHALNSKIRFWNAPDDVNAWKIFMNLKVDYINTDHITMLYDFLNKKEMK
jgi:alkaline phosphatase